MSLPDPALLLITDRRQAGRPVPEIAARAFAAGARWLSVREKDLSDEDLASLFSEISAKARRAGARLQLHGAAERAAALGADGVHLPSGSDPRTARSLLGPGRLVGLSVHAGDDPDAPELAEADYLLLGPVFPTASKPGYGPALGLEGLARFAAAAPCPVIALGGIGPANAAKCLEAGAAGIAVMGAVMRAGDPSAEAAGLLAAMRAAQPRPR